MCLKEYKYRCHHFEMTKQPHITLLTRAEFSDSHKDDDDDAKVDHLTKCVMMMMPRLTI